LRGQQGVLGGQHGSVPAKQTLNKKVKQTPANATTNLSVRMIQEVKLLLSDKGARKDT